MAISGGLLCNFVNLHDIIRYSGENEVFHRVFVEILVFSLKYTPGTLTSTQEVLIVCGMMLSYEKHLAFCSKMYVTISLVLLCGSTKTVKSCEYSR